MSFCLLLLYFSIFEVKVGQYLKELLEFMNGLVTN